VRIQKYRWDILFVWLKSRSRIKDIVPMNIRLIWGGGTMIPYKTDPIQFRQRNFFRLT